MEICIDDNYQSDTLFELVKKPLKSYGSIVAFEIIQVLQEDFHRLLLNPVHMLIHQNIYFIHWKLIIH